MQSLLLAFANLEAAVAECISICKKDNVCNPVEILRCAQKLIVQGRPLDVNSPDQPLDGETNFVSIDRFNILESAMEEFKNSKPKTHIGSFILWRTGP